MKNNDTQMKINEIYNEVIKKLTAAGYKDNWVHGLPHLERVRKNYRLLLRHAKLPANIAKSLKIAIEAHDVGRAFAGNHAENSARIFKQMRISDLSEKEKDDIEFAIQYHNKGLLAIGIKKPRKTKEILLGLLCLLDHMDAIGKIGTHRAYQWFMETQKHPKILSKIPLAQLKIYLKKGPAAPEIRNSDPTLKEESLLGSLIYNYLATFEIVSAAKKLLGKKLLNIIKIKNQETLEEINYLISLAEENKTLK